MTYDADPAATILARCGRGGTAPAMALAQLLLSYREVGMLQEVLDGALRAAAGEDDPVTRGARALRRLLESHQGGVADALAILAEEPDGGAPTGSLATALEQRRLLFDAAVRLSPATSVALYSLGDEALLAEATAELAGFLVRLGVVAPERDVLDIGCGIGRLEQALAPHVASITGIDLSAGMIEAARERCAGLANVRLLQTDGRVLRMLGEASFDAVLAIDSLPYLYQAGGPAFVLAQLREADRVLRRGGDLLAMNLSYRGDPGLDRADAGRFAGALGYRLLRDGTQDLRTWDGRAFHWRKPGDGLD